MRNGKEDPVSIFSSPGYEGKDPLRAGGDIYSKWQNFNSWPWWDGKLLRCHTGIISAHPEFRIFLWNNMESIVCKLQTLGLS